MGTPIPLDIFAKISYIKNMEYLIIKLDIIFKIFENSINWLWQHPIIFIWLCILMYTPAIAIAIHLYNTDE